MDRGKFISFEGLDGVGKSTQMEKLAGWLRQRGIHVLTTREPGGTSMGQNMRSLLLSSRTEGLSPLAELALMFADRAQHVDEKILPALERGDWVLCDRFTDSSEAYQGGGRQLGSEVVLQLQKALCRDLKPDLTILMLTDLSHSLNRARRRNAEDSKHAKEDENRFEKENRQFHQRVLNAYLAVADREPQRVVKIEAKDAISRVHNKITAAVAEKFGLPSRNPTT